MKITLRHKETGKFLLEYESDFVPAIGDRFAPIDMPDNYGRIVIGRLVLLGSTNGCISLDVDYTYPNIVSPKKTSDLEGDLIGTKLLS